MAVKLGGAKDYSAMQGPCPDGFHIPTSTERNTVYTRGRNMSAWSSNKDYTHFRDFLLLPSAGYRFYDGTISGQGSYGVCWECNMAGTLNAECITYIGTISPQNTQRRSCGHTIRAFKDVPVVPDNTWTTLYDGSSTATGAGIFHNATLGIISISADGQTWITIADKNVGATTAWSSGATLSEANCGKYYQRGNNYGFPWTGSVTTSSTRVDATNYGPGNYYSSSTFITYNGSWDTSNNGNLRGGVTGIRPSELYKAYIGEWYISPLSISLNKTSISLITVGQTEQLTATILPDGARQTVTWTSSNTSVARVDSTGLVTCVTPGDATITATTVNGLTATCNVTQWDYPFVPTANTVAYYPLTSVSQLQDMSGNNHTLTNNSDIVTFGTNYGVSCAYFPGKRANYLYVSNPTYLPSGTAARTMSIWGYFVGSTSTDSLMIFWGQWSSSKLFGLFVYNGGVYFSGYSADTSRYTFSKNVWHHVLVTYSGNQIKLYLNGSLKETKSATLSTTTPLFGIGGHGSQHYWSGGLSDAIVENRERTATEVTNYYNATKSIYGK